MQEKKKTVIVGSSARPGRYAYLAAQLLDEKGIEFVPLGISEGSVFGRDILNIKEKPLIQKVHTITMYISSPRQEEYMDYLLSLRPDRIIFNPGSENQDFMVSALQEGVIVEEACTLVLLRTNQY